MTVELFAEEMEAALRSFDRHIVCLEKPTDECKDSLHSLIQKAIQAYANREPGLRHGIALDRQITVILSQSHEEKPLCGIYFNLHSPYLKPAPAASEK